VTTICRTMPAEYRNGSASETSETSSKADDRSSREEVFRRLFIVIALYAFPAICAVKPVIDPDIWWHLRTGQWIVQHRAVPATDPFSSYGLDKPWVAYSWLFELLVYGLYRWLGLFGVIVYRVGMMLVVAAGIHRLVAKREPRFTMAIGLVGAALMALAPLVSERPWMFTILFFTLTLDAVLDLREGRSSRWVWLLPFLYALWANLHIQFVYGLFVLALACVAPWIDRRLRGKNRHADAAEGHAWRRLVVLSGACFAATFLNPYGGRIYGVVLEYATQPVPFRVVSELTAMKFHEPWDWAALALAGWAAFTLGRRARLSAFDAGLLIAAAFSSFHAQRDVWFLALAALAIVVSGHRTRVPMAERFALTWPRTGVVAGSIAVILAITAWSRGLSETHLEEKIAAVYPAKAAEVVERRGYHGPLYNDFDWGGYLIWRLPRLPVAMDGRTNLHGDRRIERSCETWAGKRGWDADPELKSAGLVIADAKGPLASLLRHHQHFELAHEDTVAAVFVAR
jgi:hypothetical protein